MDRESFAWQTAFTLVLGFVLLAIFWLRRRRRIRPWPPGPTPWPILGNLPHLGPLPHHSFMELAKKYGPIMSLKLGTRNAVVVSSPELAEEFLKNHDISWASRMGTSQGMIMVYGCTGITFMKYGRKWRSEKKFLTLELLTSKRVHEFQNSRKEEIIRGVKNLLDGSCAGSRAVSVAAVAKRIVLNVMLRVTNGIKCDASPEENNKKGGFQTTIADVFELMGTFYIPDFVPWCSALVQRGLRKRMYRTAQDLDTFFQSVLDDHREKLLQVKDDAKPQDVVDALLTHPVDLEGRLRSDDEMKGTMMEIILGGSHTASTVLEWAMSEVLKNPRVLERVQEEMDLVVGKDRLVRESDLDNLPYLNAVVKETFRLHPPGPFLIPHVSSEESEVSGYKFPVGTWLFVHVYAIQRDPKVWENPLEFCPERFLYTKRDLHGQDFDLLPFGSGRRMCPGKGFGYLQVCYAMAVFLQACNWSLPLGTKPEDLDMDERYGLTVNRLNPLQAVVTPRLALDVLLEDDT